MTVTAAQLRQLVEVPLDKQDSDLAPFLAAANLIRTEDLAGSGLSSGRLDQIELFLAAHYFTIAIEHGGLTYQKQGNSGEGYRTPDDKLTGFSSTSFGQSAIALDTSNTLVGMSSTKKAQFKVVGRSGNWNERYCGE